VNSISHAQPRILAGILLAFIAKKMLSIIFPVKVSHF
jgi:hypothetical protein